MNNFSLDGNLNEWKYIDPVLIDLYLGDYLNPLEDCKATFKSAFKKNDGDYYKKKRVTKHLICLM